MFWIWTLVCNLFTFSWLPFTGSQHSLPPTYAHVKEIHQRPPRFLRRWVKGISVTLKVHIRFYEIALLFSTRKLLLKMFVNLFRMRSSKSRPHCSRWHTFLLVHKYTRERVPGCLCMCVQIPSINTLTHMHYLSLFLCYALTLSYIRYISNIGG